MKTKTRKRPAAQIYRIIKERGFTQTEAGWILGIPQPHVTALVRNRPGTCNVVNFSNNPIEVIESEYPILIERYGYVADTGGSGKFRGGLVSVPAGGSAGVSIFGLG